VCALLGARLLGSADDTVPVWALEGDLVAGQPLTSENVRAVEIRFTSARDADGYLSAAHALPEGAALVRDVAGGELLPRAAVGRVGDIDLVELPVRVPAQAVPATISTGASVDLWVTPPEAVRSELVFESVPVLALPVESSSLDASADRQLIVGIDATRQRELPESLALLASGDVVVTSRAHR
jgi:hypothetical protein